MIRSKCVLGRIERFYLSNTMLERVLKIKSAFTKKNSEVGGRGGVERKTERKDNEDLRRCE